MVGNFVAGLQMILFVYTELCELAGGRTPSGIMVDHARALRANAVIAMRYDATGEIAQGVTEVLAYGTAVRLEPRQSGCRTAESSGGQLCRRTSAASSPNPRRARARPTTTLPALELP